MTRVFSAVLAPAVLALACARESRPDTAATTAALDSLDGQLSRAYHDRDAKLYGTLWSDSAVFEWPALPSLRGPAALSAMATDIWTGERDVELRVRPTTRRVAPDHATEWGAFEQAWTDSAGKRQVEYGRYVTAFAKQPSGSWRIDRWLGFEDSTRAAAGGK